MPHINFEDIGKDRDQFAPELEYCVSDGEYVLIESDFIEESARSILEIAEGFLDTEKYELKLGIAADIMDEDNPEEISGIFSFCLFVKDKTKKNGKSLKWISFERCEFLDGLPEEIVMKRPHDKDIVFNIYAPMVHKTIRTAGGYTEEQLLGFMGVNIETVMYTCKNPHKK